RRDALGRRLEDVLDHRASEAGARLDDAHTQPVARQPAAHEQHVAVDAADAFAAEREIVDGELDRVPAPRFRHADVTIEAAQKPVNLAGTEQAWSMVAAGGSMIPSDDLAGTAPRGGCSRERVATTLRPPSRGAPAPLVGSTRRSRHRAALPAAVARRRLPDRRRRQLALAARADPAR